MRKTRPQHRPAVGRLDRWATLNQFTNDDLAKLTSETGSPATGLIWYALFAQANGRDGRVRASSRWLASKTGLARNTCKTGLRHLLKLKMVERDPAGRGWLIVRHLEKE